ELGGTALKLSRALLERRPRLREYVGRDVILGVRPEDIEDAALAARDGDDARLGVRVALAEPMGADVIAHFPVAGEAVAGSATAAFQIEGATRADGKGVSNWDHFCTIPGKVLGGDTGEPACEHYYRLEDDLELMTSLGLQGYRFSIAWTRIQPNGRGPANEK